MNYKLKFSKIVTWAGSFLLILISGVLGTVVILSYQNTVRPVGVVIHHSAVTSPQGDYLLDVKAIDEIHRRRGYSIFYWGQTYHVGYHYIILPDGTLQSGRPEKCKGAHTKGFNDFIGICLIGDFSLVDNKDGNKINQEPTHQQVKTLAEIINDLQRKYNIPLENVQTHKQIDVQTECPGENFSFESFFKQSQNLNKSTFK